MRWPGLIDGATGFRQNQIIQSEEGSYCSLFTYVTHTVSPYKTNPSLISIMISYPLPTAGKESRPQGRSSHSSFQPLALKAQGLSSAQRGHSLLPNFKTCVKGLRVLFLAFFFFFSFLGKGCRWHFDEHYIIAIINSHTSERLWLHPWLTRVFQE